jgi:hypothetical protein
LEDYLRDLVEAQPEKWAFLGRVAARYPDTEEGTISPNREKESSLGSSPIITSITNYT